MGNPNDLPEPLTNTFLLFFAIFISALNAYLSTILNLVCLLSSKLHWTSENLKNLKIQLLHHTQECSRIDMTDEFAKYARIQRKIIKLEDEIKQNESSQVNYNMKLKFGLRIAVGLFCILVMYLFNSQPVVHMPSAWFYPLSNMLCWPGSQPGTISFLVWAAITNSFFRTFS